MLRSEISSDVEVLSELSMSFPWIPDKETIRPSDEILLYKTQTLNDICEKWNSIEDYILFRIFGKAFSIENGRYVVKDFSVDRNKKVFRTNDFPYNIPVGNHWVMWYASKDRDFDSHQITHDISHSILQLLGHNNYDFAWYVNPKMTVPEFFHVQVFWIEHQNFR